MAISKATDGLFSPAKRRDGACFQAAEREALNEEVLTLYDQFRRPLQRYLGSLGLSALDTEEALQETFLALLRHLRQGKPRHNLRAWLFRVAHNQGLKFANRAERVTGEKAEPRDCEPNPEQLCYEAQRQSRLASVVGSLSDADRECLALRVEGLRYREIADVLGISLGSVAVSLKRSLGKLAQVYGR